MRSALKEPSKAVFLSRFDREVTIDPDGVGGYHATGFVEVQDAPGVVIRWQWSASVRRGGSGRWERVGRASIGGRAI